ncbi:hypothetical protein PsalMR5_00692 [Piscirickettsia salmonis]|uniref:hypothetical protein n=1 Tax=Piscirickettsia salmonis TaxID=1238 RepID=UPI0012BA9D8E|nr:hypothetical protein [Piscirickettsia salmonis]QGP53286.1 hypothetical protein PsalSR1_00694 [Piscirickettsia salmonis]QGP60793.1 hypothetical protein PsalBI1_03414 [Piscirickettsia salmonis]QGP62851.1 hypothetical protein PsalMR5_00692 [Piscirickettsia salmonis]
MLPKFKDLQQKALDFMHTFIRIKDKDKYSSIAGTHEKREERKNLLYQLKDDIEKSRSIHELLQPLGTVQRNELTQQYLYTAGGKELTELGKCLNTCLKACKQYLGDLHTKKDKAAEEALDKIRNDILQSAKAESFEFGWGGTCHSVQGMPVPRRVQQIYEAITSNQPLGARLTIVNDILATAKPDSGYKAGLLWWGRTQNSTTEFLQGLDCPELH